MPTSTPMQLGMVGLGRMGAGLVGRLMRDGHNCVVYDVNPAAVTALEKEGATGSTSMAEFVEKLTQPRAVWVMVPAGEITAKTITDLASHLSSGDIIIDGGNTYYRDDIRHAKALSEKGIHHIDCGTSGGVWGIDRGFCLMIGGEDEIVQHLRPIFATIAPGLGTVPANPGAHRGPRRCRAGVLALRSQRRRPLRQNGPQRDRVRHDGIVRRRPQHFAQRQRRQGSRRARETPRPPRWRSPSSTSTTSTPPR